MQDFNIEKLLSMEPIEIAGIAVPGLLIVGVVAAYFMKWGPFKKRRRASGGGLTVVHHRRRGIYSRGRKRRARRYARKNR